MSIVNDTLSFLGDVSAPLFLKRGDSWSFRVGLGGGAIRIHTQYSTNGLAWRNLPVNYDDVFADIGGDFSKRKFDNVPEDGQYRLICTEYAAGSYPVQLSDEPSELDSITSQTTGRKVWRVTEAGVEGPEVQVIHSAVSALAVVVKSFGTSPDEGLVEKKFDETLSLVGIGAAFLNLTDVLPAGVVPMSIQCVVAEPITSNGTRVKVGIGPSSDPDKYCLTADDDLGTAANSDPWPTVGVALGAQEQLRINGCTAAGAQAAENFTDGAVRVSGAYLQLLDLLPEAIINFP
jgi:hypothetical protein